MKSSEKKVVFIQGNEACAEGAIAAGVRFFAGYPITPSSEIAHTMARRLPPLGGVFMQMEDEIGSLGAVIGASISGTKAMTATSASGFTLMQEFLGYASAVEIPCLIVDIQRAGPMGGMATRPSQGDVMQARWGTHGDHPVIALAISSAAEMFNLTIRGVNLSERFRVPVILLSDEVIGHLREKIELPDPEEIQLVHRKRAQGPREKFEPLDAPEDGVPPMACFGDGYRASGYTSMIRNQLGDPSGDPKIQDFLMRRLHNKIYKHLDEILSWEEFHLEDAEIAILAYGSPFRSAVRAMKTAREKGIKVGIWKAITIWPFPDQPVRTLAAKVPKIIVPEMNLGQVFYEVERCACGRAEVFPLQRVDGNPITAQEILKKIEEVR
jgi:2-oxoglutarate ferredoxin oxidoreductase subunit alpha